MKMVKSPFICVNEKKNRNNRNAFFFFKVISINGVDGGKSILNYILVQTEFKDRFLDVDMQIG